MPAALLEGSPNDNHMVLAGRMANLRFAYSTRYLIVLLKGEFTLEEASDFAHANFKLMEDMAFDKQGWFENSPKVETLGVTYKNDTQPSGVADCVIRAYTRAKFLDSYEWHVVRHCLQKHFACVIVEDTSY